MSHASFIVAAATAMPCYAGVYNLGYSLRSTDVKCEPPRRFFSRFKNVHLNQSGFVILRIYCYFGKTHIIIPPHPQPPSSSCLMFFTISF